MNIRSFLFRSVFAFAALAILTTIGCNSDHGNKIIIQLNWTPDPTFTGEYIALDMNFFANEGIDQVEIHPGGFGVDPFAPIVSKKADFAIVGADKAAIAFSNGAPIKVVAVDFQRNPVGWIVRRAKGVTKITDLVGRNDLVLGDKIGTETTAILKVMLNRLGISDKITPQAVGFEFGYFVQQEHVVFPVYLNEEPVTARIAKIEVNEIDPSNKDNGDIKLYGNVIITHQDTVDKHPEIVKAFIYALRKGWEFAMNNQDQSVNILKKRKEFDTPQLKEVLARSVNFATSLYGIKIAPGHMEIGEWENTLS